MRASLCRSGDEFEDGVAHGGQSWQRRRPVDFFPALLRRGRDAGEMYKRSSPSAHDGEGLAKIVLGVIETEFFFQLLM